MRLGFGGKLLTVTFGLLSLLTTGALLSVRHEFGKQLRHQAEREIRAGSRVLTSILERSSAQLADRGKVLSELPSLKKALSKNPEELEPLLIEVKSIRAANLLWATDPTGKVLASTGEYPALGENLSGQPLIGVALQGQTTLGFDMFGGQWWLMLSLPVEKAGTVTLALLIGEAYLARLSELMGCQVGFIWGENQLWSENWPEETRQKVVSQTLRALAGKSQDMSFSRGHFLWLARPVTGGTPPIAAGPIALLGIPVDESVISRTSRAIGWVAILTMTLGVFLLTWAIRPILRQLEAAQLQLAQAEKLASIGELAAGVAHELNNPLMVIMGNTQLALRMLKRSTDIPAPAAGELGELLQALDQETHRSKTIVGNLLDFARMKRPAQVESDVHALLDESVRLVEHQANLQSVQVVKRYAASLPHVKADTGEMKQVFVNIILNAVQAMPEAGTLTLATSADAAHVAITIEDTGAGIPKEALAKVFDPFFTTKEVGKGTGLGLSVSYGIIQRHNGKISIDSTVGKGTTVTIKLPLATGR